MKILILILTFISNFVWANPVIDPNKSTICSISITSNLQTQALREHLTKTKEINQYQFVELTNFKASEDKTENDWVEKACSSGITCDVLIITGHFAGNFFGNNRGKDPFLSSDLLREKSCNKSCEGILRNPLEVYLFGCNTLAGKEDDGRTNYYDVLREHGHTHAQALRAQSQRYSMVGESFRDLLSGVFHGKKPLYGFTTTASRSSVTTPKFKKYFEKVGPFNDHLKKIGIEKLKDVLPKVFEKTMGQGNATECFSFSSEDKILQAICELKYGKGSIESKMMTVMDLLHDDPIKHLTIINEFIKMYENEVDNTSTYDLIKDNEELKKQILGAMKSKDAELASEAKVFGINFEYLTKDDLFEEEGAPPAFDLNGDKG